MSLRAELPPELLSAIEAGATIVTPSHRSARRLQLLFANHALSRGHKAWATPNVRSYDTFALQLWNGLPHRSERVLTLEQTKLIWENVVTSSRWAAGILSPHAAAQSSFTSWLRLVDWRISFEDLAPYAREASEVAALIDWSGKLERTCSDRNWLPSALLPQRLLRAETQRLGTIVTVGFDDLFPSQHALFAYLASRGADWRQIAPQSIAQQAIAVECASAEDELRRAAEWAKLQLESGINSIGIVVPDLRERGEDIRRRFADVLSQSTRSLESDSNTPGADRRRYESSFAIAAFHRLADFAVVRAALDILRLAVGRGSPALVGSLVRNPFLRGSDSEASLRALLDLRIRESVREHYDVAALERAAVAANCNELSAGLAEARALLREAPTRASPSASAELFVAVWRAFGWPGSESPDSDEQQSIARLRNCLGEFGALDDLIGTLSFAAAVREFERLVGDTGFEPRSRPAPITIFDSRSTDGFAFDALWVTGMNEARWPPPAAPDPFVPVAVQIRASMPNATPQLARENARRRFLALRAIASKAVFSWASHESDVEVLPSPWLAEFETSSQQSGTAVDDYAARIFAAKPTLDLHEERGGAGLRGRAVRGGSRIFELQSLCPFRAFSELRLGAVALEPLLPGIDARERGTLIHAALEDIWQSLRGSSDLDAHSVEQLEVLVRTSLARHAARLLEGASPQRVRVLQIEQELAVRRLLELFELDRRRTPFRVVGRPETKETATIGALEFELRLDRVDELLDAAHSGERVIVDYKTGGSAGTQSWLKERPEQPQLPLYAVTHPRSLAAVAFAQVSAKTVGYRGVARDGEILPEVKAFDGKKLPEAYADWTGLLEYWRSVITRLADDFAAGRAQVDPLPTACRNCHLSTLCRLSEQQDLGAALQDEEAP